MDALAYLVGPQAEGIFDAFKLTPDEQKKLNAALRGFDDCFIPRRNIMYERAEFSSRRVQRDGKFVEDSATALHTLAGTCNYAELCEELICGRLVLGLKNRKLL